MLLSTLGVGLVALVLGQAEGRPPQASVASQSGDTFSTIRVRQKPAAAAAASTDRPRPAADVLHWSAQPRREPSVVPRPQAAIVFPNINPNVTLPPRAAGTRGSSYVAPTQRPQTRRAAVRW